MMICWALQTVWQRAHSGLALRVAERVAERVVEMTRNRRPDAPAEYPGPSADLAAENVDLLLAGTFRGAHLWRRF